MMKEYLKGLLVCCAGGILIGKENISDDNIIIRYITEPYASDKRRYNRFIRKDKTSFIESFILTLPSIKKSLIFPSFLIILINI